MKNVIVIGNAPTVLLNEYGSKIDEYDIVIRINDFEIEGYEKYVGTKTNIFARAKNHEFVPRCASDFDEVWLKQGYDKWSKFGYNPISDIHTTDRSKIKLIAKGNDKRHNGTTSVSTGFATIKYAIERFYEKGNPITVYGFNFQNVKRDANISSPRPHYYLKEPPNSYDIMTTNIGKQPHNWKLERKLLKQLEQSGKIRFMNPDEVYNDEVTLDHLEPAVKHLPSHLKGQVNPTMKPAGQFYYPTDESELVDNSNKLPH